MQPSRHGCRYVQRNNYVDTLLPSMKWSPCTCDYNYRVCMKWSTCTLASSPGSNAGAGGKKRAWYPLFAHASEIIRH